MLFRSACSYLCCAYPCLPMFTKVCLPLRTRAYPSLPVLSFMGRPCLPVLKSRCGHCAYSCRVHGYTVLTRAYVHVCTPCLLVLSFMGTPCLIVLTSMGTPCLAPWVHRAYSCLVVLARAHSCLRVLSSMGTPCLLVLTRAYWCLAPWVHLA